MSDLKHCECEHEAHFDRKQHTPNGNPGHRADTFFHLDAIVPAKTPYGTFMVCLDCSRDCYAPERFRCPICSSAFCKNPNCGSRYS